MPRQFLQEQKGFIAQAPEALKADYQATGKT
jgi:hypothetical protein